MCNVSLEVYSRPCNPIWRWEFDKALLFLFAEINILDHDNTLVMAF